MAAASVVTDVVHKHTFVVQAEIDRLGIRIGGPKRRCVMECPPDSKGFSIGLKRADTIVNVNNEEDFANTEQLLINCLSKRSAFQLSVERKATPGKLFRERLAEVHGTGTRLHVRVWLPPDYTPEQQWPLIVFLHDMNQDHDQDGFLYFMKKRRPISEQAIVLAPLCPQAPVKYWWFKKGGDHNGIDAPEMIDAVVESIQYVCATFSVDVQAIHLTGSGMGGYGAWELLVQHPRLFRTVVPCCGHFDGTTDMKFRGSGRNSFKSEINKEKVDRLLWGVKEYGIRVWVLHAPDDAEFPFVDARHLVTLLKQNGCDAKLTSTGFSGHGEVAVWLYVAQEEEKKSAGNLLSEFFFPPAKIEKTPKKRNKKSRARAQETTPVDEAGETVNVAADAVDVAGEACGTNEEAIRSFVLPHGVTTPADNVSGTSALCSAPDNSAAPDAPGADARPRGSANCAPDSHYDTPSSPPGNRRSPVAPGNYPPTYHVDNPAPSTNGYYGPPSAGNYMPPSSPGNYAPAAPVNYVLHNTNGNYAPAAPVNYVLSNTNGNYTPADPVHNVLPNTNGNYAPAGSVNYVLPDTNGNYAPAAPVNSVLPNTNGNYAPTRPVNNVLPTTLGDYAPAAPVNNMLPTTQGDYAPAAPVNNMLPTTQGDYAPAAPVNYVLPNTHDNYASAAPVNYVLLPNTHGHYAPSGPVHNVLPTSNANYAPAGPPNYMSSGGPGNHAPTDPGAGAATGPPVVSAQAAWRAPPVPIPFREQVPPPTGTRVPKPPAPRRTLK